MKANAPEKIYVSNYSSGLTNNWHNERLAVNDIEYTRTDAFIEKALDYIENNIYDHYDGDHEYGICGGYVKKEEFINNFKDHMKGE